MSVGTFNVARSIWDHPVFRPSKFSEREAFLWMVSEAAGKPRTIRAGNVGVDLERGQFCASVRFMANAWGWSKSSVARFLERLENRDMIGTQNGTGQLVVTLCNYEKFQGSRDATGTAAGHSPGQERDKREEREEGEEGRIYVRTPPLRGVLGGFCGQACSPCGG